MLWPDSEEWKEGEIDFPEGDLDDSIGGYSHCTSGDPYSFLYFHSLLFLSSPSCISSPSSLLVFLFSCLLVVLILLNRSSNCFYVHTNVTYTNWHVATIEWAPSYLSFILDGTVCYFFYIYLFYYFYYSIVYIFINCSRYLEQPIPVMLFLQLHSIGFYKYSNSLFYYYLLGLILLLLL